MRRLRRPARLGLLGRTTPLSDEWGFDRGTPLDRYFIEEFLERHARDITGRVLEVMDSRYTDRFGSGVTQSDVLDIDASNARATIVADLAAADGIRAELFDCVILTQTLQFIFELRAALGHVWRITRPGGTVLCSLPAVNRLSPRTGPGDYWRFTPAGSAELLRGAFPEADLTIETPGNVLTSIALLTGLAAEELTTEALAVSDHRFPLLILVRARKPRASN